MPRARDDQYATRVNDAVILLSSGFDVPEAMRKLAVKHGISERQARRYVEQARDFGNVAVPPPTTAITTRLPSDLVSELKSYGKQSGRTLSSIIAHALKDFLRRKRPR